MMLIYFLKPSINNNGSLRCILIKSTILFPHQFVLSITSADYEKVTSARKLRCQMSMKSINHLGYISSTSRRLQNDEVLAVSYEYTYNGNRYKVGELTEDYQNRE